MRIPIIILLGLLGTVRLMAQTDVPASGGDAIGTGGTASYTIGQVFYSFNAAGNTSENQGVQQPYEISVITETSQELTNGVEWEIFPNPTTEMITLRTLELLDGDHTCTLTDMSGRLIASIPLRSENTELDMRHLAAASYLLTVSNRTNPLRTYRIIKR